MFTMYVSKLRFREIGEEKVMENVEKTVAFYRELQEKKEKGFGWVITVLSGEEAGEKRFSEDDLEETYEGERIFRERISKTPQLVICGGGHVSIPIIQIGKMLGFTVVVLEDRPKFADHARNAGADEVICESFENGLDRVNSDGDTYFVIVTRGHRYDKLCLEKILRKEHAYIGMMGSRRRVAIVKEQLYRQGAEAEILESVHTPIGLKIGAETPEEIAVSILAEIIREKNTQGVCGGYSDEMLDVLTGKQYPKLSKVLATIVSRKGSAPRSIGTKMLILENGIQIDTIGGGCAESEIISKALGMLREDAVNFQICEVDMTTESAEDEGMVCGGRIEVMLEKISAVDR